MGDACVFHLLANVPLMASRFALLLPAAALAGIVYLLIAWPATQISAVLR